jgi:hypothetical protein
VRQADTYMGLADRDRPRLGPSDKTAGQAPSSSPESRKVAVAFVREAMRTRTWRPPDQWQSRAYSGRSSISPNHRGNCRFGFAASTFALSKGSVAVTDRGSSVEVAALLKARGWSIRVLLLAAVGVLASVIYALPAAAGDAPYLRLFRADSSTPAGRGRHHVVEDPTSRFAELQGELVGLAVLAGVVALGYAGVALLGLAVSQPLASVEMRGVCATILASSAATLCLLGMLLTYWWILGVPRRATQEIEIPVPMV